MAAIPLSYVARNLWTRRLTTLLTAGGMALVVFVYTAVLMLDEGLRRTLVDTGSADNVKVLRRGAESEIESGIDRTQAAAVEGLPSIARGADGHQLLSRESVVLIALPKRAGGQPSNVVIRGVTPAGFELRPQLRIVQGRMFRSGSAEIVTGVGIAQRFAGAAVGERLRFGQREWLVTGTFDSGGSGFDSEIWGDADQLMQSFRRPVFSTLLLRLSDVDGFDRIRTVIETDPRLTLQARREKEFYADQSRVLSNFIRYLGLTLSVIFSLGAMIGAMITMYAAVSNRTGEIGTLRALGFQRASIMVAFLLEALLIGLIGGITGVAMASLMTLVSFSTTNFQSFAELAFRFALTPAIVVQAVAFSVVMGFVGGFLPAARAAQLKIVDALRAV